MNRLFRVAAVLLVLTSPLPAQAQFVPTPEALSYFQMGAYRTEYNARNQVHSLVRRGHAPVVWKEGVLFRVYLVVPEAEASVLAARLTDEGWKGFFQSSRPPVGSSMKLSTE